MGYAEDANSLEEAVRDLYSDASSVSEPADQYFARELKKMLEEHTEEGV